MFQSLPDVVLGLVRQYGFLAVFVYMALETAFLLHYVPSEVVVPFAAAELVHDPLSFALFVADATAGATVGSLLAYLLFGQYGRGVLERHGRLIHVSPERLEWSEAVFVRYGESTVFWGRLLPFVRAFISIPAGLAGMDRRRFVAYSAAGALVFNTALTYLVYSGAGTASPLEVVLAGARAALAEQVAYVRLHTAFVVVLAGTALIVAAALWVARDWLRGHPALAKQLGLHLVRIVGLLVGSLFVLGALSAPAQAFAAITSVWNDPLFWVRLGFTERVALVLMGVIVAFAGLLAYEVGRVLELAHVRAALEAVTARLRRR